MPPSTRSGTLSGSKRRAASLYASPYEGLLYEVESGAYYGQSFIGGTPVHHLAYRNAEVDWQLWVRAEGPPLPVKYVITSKWIAGAPQLTVDIRDINSGLAISEADLAFAPPAGARALDADELHMLGLAISE